MDQMKTHEQLGGSAGELRHPMQVPHLVVEGAGTQAALLQGPLTLRLSQQSSSEAIQGTDHRELLNGLAPTPVTESL